MDVKSACIHANHLFGGEQNCRLESDYLHFYIFGNGFSFAGVKLGNKKMY